ncbi:MAG: SCO family protein [Sneathiellales bacterium]|nr:SCO family protein [Sneathiellales bacterium]
MRQNIAATFCAIILGGAGLIWATDGLQAFTAEGARRLEISNNRPFAPDPILETMEGYFRPLKEAPSKITLIEFIYTTCPTICQSAGGEFARLRDLLVKQEIPVRMISISFDPQQDTVEALSDYGELHGALGKVWTVARPDIADLEALLDFFMVTVIPDDWGGYQHNTAVLLIDKGGRFSGVFDTNAYQAIVQAVKAASR